MHTHTRGRPIGTFLPCPYMGLVSRAPTLREGWRPRVVSRSRAWGPLCKCFVDPLQAASLQRQSSKSHTLKASFGGRGRRKKGGGEEEEEQGEEEEERGKEQRNWVKIHSPLVALLCWHHQADKWRLQVERCSQPERWAKI